MRKDEMELLHNINSLTTNQLPLLEAPQTPQQQSLHLFAHRVLVDKNLFHRCLDRVRPCLPGTFAQKALQTSVITSFLENSVDCSGQKSVLVKLIEQWVNFYPAVRTAKQEWYVLSDIVQQGGLQPSMFGGLANYLTYLNIISADLWRILRKKKSDQDFSLTKPFKEELKEIAKERCGDWLNANNLLTFVSGCIPKTLLNIIMTSETLPTSMKKMKSFECLFANHNVQFILRRSTKLALLLRQILMVVLTMELDALQQRLLMLVAMRYYYVFHYDRKYSSTELVVHAYNRLTQEPRKALSDEFALFFKIILKLGKEKFINFIGKNSPFASRIVELVMRRPSIGYPQEAASPYSTADVAEVIEIERGAKMERTFEVLEDHSIFYFRIQVVSLDITIRLYYLGSISSEKETKKLLLTHEKVEGELKSSINAVKRGLYLFQFDNSFSWLNSKRVRYQNEVLAPLQIRAVNEDQWIGDFYQNQFMNDILNEEEDVILVDTTKVEKSKENESDKKKGQSFKTGEFQEERGVSGDKEGRQGLGVVSVDRRQNILRVVVRGRTEQYTYETDNAERMLQKIQKLSSSKEKYRWRVNNRPTQDLKEVQDFIQGEEFQPKQPAVPKEEIDPNEYNDDPSDQPEEAEYQVVERSQLEKSQIINESSASLKAQPSQSRQSSKQTITASASELQQASC